MVRRTFIRMALFAPAVLAFGRALRAQGLGQFAQPSVPCADGDPTPAAPDEKTYKPKSPARADIAPGVKGQRLALTGAVAGKICGPIKDATVEFWQADDKGQYDMAGFALRGQQKTDAMGVYRLETVVPGAAPGRARRLNVRVSAAGKPTLETQIFFPDDPATARDPVFKPGLAMVVSAKTPAKITAQFNLILNA